MSSTYGIVDLRVGIDLEGIRIGEGADGQRIPAVFLPSVVVHDFRAVFLGRSSFGHIELRCIVRTPEGHANGRSIAEGRLTVETLHPLEEEFVLGVVERELEIVVLQPSIVTAVPRGVEVGSGVVVEQDSEFVVSSRTFLRVSHRASELVGRLHESVHSFHRAGGSRFDLVARSVDCHVAIAGIECILRLVDESLEFGVAAGLLHELAQLGNFTVADGAHVPRRTVGGPVPRHHVGQRALGVDTGVFGRGFGQVRRIEGEESGDLRVRLNVVGVDRVFGHRDRLVELRSRTDVVAGLEVTEIEQAFFLGCHHFPHHFASVVREGVGLTVVDAVVFSEGPAEGAIAGIHGRAVIECTAVVAGAGLCTPARHDVIAGYERVGRGNEILVSGEDGFGHRFDFGIGAGRCAVGIGLGLFPECHELVVLLLGILCHTVAERIVLDFLVKGLSAGGFLHHALEGLDGTLLRGGIDEPNVAAVVGAERNIRGGVVAGIVEQRHEGAGGFVGLIGFYRSDGQAIVEVQVGSGCQIQIGEVIVVLRLVDVGIHALVLRGCFTFGVGMAVGVLRIAVDGGVHHHFPSAFHRRGVDLRIAGLGEVIAVLPFDVINFGAVFRRHAGHFLEVVDEIGSEAGGVFEAVAPKEPCGAGGFRASGLQEIRLSGLHILGRGGAGRGIVRPVATICPHDSRSEQETGTDHH